MSRYRIYTDRKGKVIVVSTYAGKNVRGVQARCDLKIAEKRVKRAKGKYDATVAVFNKASKDVDKAAEYVLHAERLVVEACKALEACGKDIVN